MTSNDAYPTWRNPWKDDSYQRLVNIARSRLAGMSHLAEDAVQEALISWHRSNAASNPRAQIETVVISRAHDLRRKMTRSQQREWKVTADTQTSNPSHDPDTDLAALRLTAHQNYAALWVDVDIIDSEILELLLSGHNQTETAEHLRLTRAVVRSSINRWRLALRYASDTT